MKGRRRHALAGVLVTLALIAAWGRVQALGQSGETAGMITEIKVGHGKVEVRTPGAQWRPAAPLSALRAGDQIRAVGDATAVVLLTGGRGTVVVEAKSSPYRVEAAQTDEGKARKARSLLSQSLDFLAAGSSESPKALTSSRGSTRPPEILTPRDGPVFPDSLVFEWLGSQFSRYTVRVVDPSGVVLERKGVVGARFTYPADAPVLKPGVRYRFQVGALGHPATEAWFELVDQTRAGEVRDNLQQLEAALGPGVSTNSLTAVRVGALAANGLFHDARLVAQAALANDPDEPMLHLLLGNLYLKTGLPRLAAQSIEEANFLLSRQKK